MTQPKRSSRSRIADDVDQGLGGLGLARTGGRAAQLVDHDCIDQLAVHLLEPDDLIAVDAETGAADRLAGGKRGLGREVERDRRGAGHQHEEAGEAERGELVRARAADGARLRALR